MSNGDPISKMLEASGEDELNKAIAGMLEDASSGEEEIAGEEEMAGLDYTSLGEEEAGVDYASLGEEVAGALEEAGFFFPRRRRRRRRAHVSRRPAAAASAGAWPAAIARMAQAKRYAPARHIIMANREYIVGIDSVATIAAAASLAIIARPQGVFKPTRFIVSGAIAASFIITDIRVGNKPQLLTTGAIPSDMFTATSQAVPIDFDTCQLAMDLTVTVTNISAGPLRFTAGFIGKTNQ